MSEISKLIQTHNEYLKMILFAVFAIMLIVFAVHYFTEKLRFPKYLPGLVVLVVGIIMLVGLIPNLVVKEYLGNIVIACITIGVGVIGLCFGLILGVIFKSKKTYEKDKIEYDEY